MNEPSLEQVLMQRPRALLTDIDGTISPLAATPADAVVSATARSLLHTLSRRFDLVAAITGRAVADAVQMVGLPELRYIGNHGMEQWRDGQAAPLPAAAAYAPAISAALKAARDRITLPGMLFEHKGVTGAIHYRLTSDPDVAHAEIARVLEPLAAQHQLRLTRGHLVFELRPPLAINKGTAVRSLIEQRQLRGAIFMGDDRTDADAFAVLRELRAQRVCATLNVGVITATTPTVIREQADVLVAGVGGVEALLHDIVTLTTANDQSAPGG